MSGAVRSEQGQLTVLTIGLSVVAFAICGLAVDGTRAFVLRRSLQNAADAAALAGSAQLDRYAYYESGGESILLEPGAARRTAAEWIGGRPVEARATVEADTQGVYVILRGRVPTTFLRLIGIASVPVAVEARAEPVSGPPDPR